MKCASLTNVSTGTDTTAATQSSSNTSLPIIGDRVLRLREVTRVVGLSSATIHRRVKAGSFPKPLRLGGGAAVGWLWSDLQGWLQSCRMERQP